jgi:hypothetical protein
LNCCLKAKNKLLLEHFEKRPVSIQVRAFIAHLKNGGVRR